MTSQDPCSVVERGVPDTVQLLRELLEVRQRMAMRAQPSNPPPRRASLAPPPAT